MCVIGRKIFPTKPQRVCLGENTTTPAICSELSPLPTAITEKVLCFFLLDIKESFVSGCNHLCFEGLSSLLFVKRSEWDCLFITYTSGHVGRIVSSLVTWVNVSAVYTAELWADLFLNVCVCVYWYYSEDLCILTQLKLWKFMAANATAFGQQQQKYMILLIYSESLTYVVRH